MEKRAIFPIIMFFLSGVSFAFGGWQYFHARSVQSSAQARMAFMVTTIENSDVSRTDKQELYATIMKGLPEAPGGLSIDFSGSFASVEMTDHCSTDGQRAVCRALLAEGSDTRVVQSVCGLCRP